MTRVLEQLYEDIREVVECSHCKKKYVRYSEPQIPGFREKSEDICPYCSHINGYSMDYDYESDTIGPDGELLGI